MMMIKHDKFIDFLLVESIGLIVENFFSLLIEKKSTIGGYMG